jgi:hypothetical protein
MERHGLDDFASRYWQDEGCCEHGNGSLGS